MSNIIDSLLARCVTFDEEHQNSDWQYEIAKSLNSIVARVEYQLTTCGDESDINFARAALGIVELVADGEEIKPIEAAHIDIGEGPNP